jgi:hypothetical protein
MEKDQKIQFCPAFATAQTQLAASANIKLKAAEI